MSADKTASVHWTGAGKDGKGEISTETGALNKAPYGFASRFGDDRKATNPEEILAAAHAPRPDLDWDALALEEPAALAVGPRLAISNAA